MLSLFELIKCRHNNKTVFNSVTAINALPASWVLVAIVTLFFHIELNDCTSVYDSNNVDILPRHWRHISDYPKASCSNVHVEVLISPHIEKDTHDLLAIYWEAVTTLAGDKVELFDHDPSLDISNPLVSVLVDQNTGWVITDVSEGSNCSLPAIFNKVCLGYWAAYIRGDSGLIADYSCLTTEPRWMEETWDAISNLSVANTFLPGTHNAASYKKCYEPSMDTVVYKYTFNQDISILHQLIWGVRVLDLRIGYYPNSFESWWCNHDFVRIRPLIDVLNEIKEFLEYTQEIVILDVHNFPVGFTKNSKETHKNLVSYLEKELSGYLAPKTLGWSATLRDIKSSGKRAILAYNSKEAPTIYTWPPVRHKWGDKRTLKEFTDYFHDQFNGYNIAPWAAMAELTARPFDVFFNRLGGLRQMAAEVNPSITSWFNGNWGRLCHIVHCDFIRGSGIVKAAIKWNLKRAGFYKCIF